MNDRVHVTIQVNEIQWILVTSRDAANAFLEEWRAVDDKKILTIHGVLDHRDANVLEYHLPKEDIRGMQIQTIAI